VTEVVTVAVETHGFKVGVDSGLEVGVDTAPSSGVDAGLEVGGF